MPSRSNPASPSVLDLHPVFTHQGEDGSEGEKEGKAMHNHDQEVKEYEARMQEHRKAAEDEEKKKSKEMEKEKEREAFFDMLREGLRNELRKRKGRGRGAKGAGGLGDGCESGEAGEGTTKE